jgi:hypothetical protein
MATNQADKAPRRIAVILGSGGSGRSLLDLVLPLLSRGREVEMHGVFLEEAEVRHAAELPFVKELCRVTFNVREFNSDQFERALSLRMRTARRALAVLARRTGVTHSFRNVRGPAISLLLDAASGSDITMFEPARMIAASGSQPLSSPRVRQRIAVAVGDLESARRALIAAGRLARGDATVITAIVAPEVMQDRDGISRLWHEILPRRPLRVRVLSDESGMPGLVDAVHREGATLFVAAANEAFLQPATLQVLRERLRCPVCLVREWDEGRDQS